MHWQLLLALLLIALSALLFSIHYLLFHDVFNLFFYLVHGIAFLPIEVLLVTVIINRMLMSREKRARMEKLNMVIGAFFSEVGTKLLMLFSDWDPTLDQIRSALVMTGDWAETEFRAASRGLRAHAFSVDMSKADLARLRGLLGQKTDFMLRLLENPVLLEHETFTDLLRAVFHLSEELQSRKEVTKLAEPDQAHLAGDLKRGYVLLVREWLDYMSYLKANFPYLFSLAMRTNPFDESASPEVK